MSFVLEEQVAVVLDSCLQVELVHETACSLHGHLLELCLLLLGIHFGSLAFLLLKNLEHIGGTITLDGI